MKETAGACVLLSERDRGTVRFCHAHGVTKPYRPPHKISAAVILAEYFQADVEFLKRIVNSKSADVLIGGTVWEIKSPTGKGKRNVQHTLSAALKQSRCIVFDARRSKIHINRIKGELQRQFAMTASIECLLLIRKDKSVVELSRWV